MNMFQSSELFGAFVAFVVLFIILLIYDHFNNQSGTEDVRRSNRSRRTFRFQLKRILARLLLKMRKNEEIPDNVVDQLQVFSDHDEMVSVFSTN